MSFANQTTRWVYTPNGATTSFAYDNKVLAAADLVVSWIAADGSTLTLPSYSVTGVGNDAGGAVVFSTAPATVAGSRIVIERNTAAVQEGAFLDFLQESAATRQQRFERSMALAQELKTALNRAIRYSPLDADGALILPPAAARANQALVFDALGRPTVGTVVQGSLVVASFVQGLLGSSSATAFLTGLGFSGFMAGLRTAADAPALLTAEGWSAFMQSLKGSADAAAVKIALGITTETNAWTVGSDIDTATSIDLDSTAGGAVVGDERGLASPGTAIATIAGSQRTVRLVAKADGIKLTHNVSAIVSRTASDIVMRSGDAVTLARTGASAWREISFEANPLWKTANLSGVAAATTLTAIPHHLGKRVGAIRMFGKCTANDAAFTPAMFSATGAKLEFPRGAAATQLGWDARVDDTNVTVAIASSGLGVVRTPGGGGSAIVPGNWDLWLEIDPR